MLVNTEGGGRKKGRKGAKTRRCVGRRSVWSRGPLTLASPFSRNASDTRLYEIIVRFAIFLSRNSTFQCYFEFFSLSFSNSFVQRERKSALARYQRWHDTRFDNGEEEGRKCSNLFEQWQNAMRDGRRGDKRFRRFNVTRYFPTRILIVVSSWERTMVSINHAPRCLQLRWDYKLVEMIPPDLRPCNTYICYVRGRISWGNAQYCTKKFQGAKWDSNRLLNCIYLLFD